MTALEIGADMGGSLRVPAAFCGVFSHKPTYGLVPQRGYVPPVDAVAELDMAVVGPMARSARDLRLLLSVIAAAPNIARAQPLALHNLKIGLWLDEPSFTLDPEVKAPIISLSERLAAMGAIIEPIKSPAPGLEMMRAYTTLLLAVVGYEMPWPQRAFYELLRGPAKLARALGAGPFFWAHGALAVTARHSEWLGANEVRAKLSASVTSVFSRYNLLLAPATPVVAFPHNHAPMPLRRLKLSDKRSVDYLEMLDWVGFATIFGLPATTVPAGLSASGLPVGVQIIGAHGCDSLTISFAEAIEAQIGGYGKPPNC